MRCTVSRRVPGSLRRSWAAITSLGSRATRAASSKKPSTCSPSRVFPPQGSWDKGHGRLDHRRLARVAVSPESIGLCGGWQVIAVERTSLETTAPDAPPSAEIGCYATSLTLDQHHDAAILGIIRGHWSAIENGTPTP